MITTFGKPVQNMLKQVGKILMQLEESERLRPLQISSTQMSPNLIAYFSNLFTYYKAKKWGEISSRTKEINVTTGG